MVDLITADMMREAVRARIAAGVDQHSISHLICLFAKSSPAEEPRIDRRVPRLPVECVPERDRAAFLAALGQQRPSGIIDWLPGLPLRRVVATGPASETPG